MAANGSKDAPNAHVAGLSGTAARTQAEARIEQLRGEGGVFVEAVRATRMPMAVTDPSLPGNPIVFANDAFLGLSGYSMDEVLGQEPHFMNGADTDGADAARFRLALDEDRDEVIETVQYRKDGSRFVASVFLSAFKDKDGSTRHQFLSYLDVTRRVTAEDELISRAQIEQALQESESRLRVLMEGIPQLVWRAVEKGLWTWASPQWLAGTGQTQRETHGLGWLDAIHPDDRDATMEAWDQAAFLGMLETEHRIRRASDGAYLWHYTRAVPVRDRHGRIVEWLGTSTDVQQTKELRERQDVMVAELQHRSRNLIAVVRSIAGQAMAQTGPNETFRDAFDRRLEALARVQGLLSRAEVEPVTIQTLIVMELDALGAREDADRRIVLEGPPVRLRSSMVQTLALALHELATNARKHGALSRDEGRLSITWRVVDTGDDGRRLQLMWVEASPNGERNTVPERRGYGRELIERALPYALGAKTTYELRPEGVVCTIDLPLEKRSLRRR